MRNLFPAPFFGYILNVFSFTKKRKYVRTKTPLRLNQNVLAFRIKRLCVLRCTENSCQFENLFLTKLTG